MSLPGLSRRPLPRPLPVLSLRHEGSASQWLDTWRRLTEVVFETGLAGPGTLAVGVVYDYPWRAGHEPRYDACLTVRPDELDRDDLHRRFEGCPGLRYEVIMADPGVTRLETAHVRRISDMAVQDDEQALRELHRIRPVGLPMYEVYGGSPIFAKDEVRVVAHFETVTRSPSGSQRPGSTNLGELAKRA